MALFGAAYYIRAMIRLLCLCLLSISAWSCQREYNCACTAVHTEGETELLRKHSVTPIMANDKADAQADCSFANQDRMVYSVRVRINCEIVP